MNDYGPYETFVREKLHDRAPRNLSELDIIDLRNTTDYVRNSEYFLGIVRAYEDRLFCDAPSSVLMANALFTIASIKGKSFESHFEKAWQILTTFLDDRGECAPEQIDLDTEFNGIRLGLAAGKDISRLLNRVYECLQVSTNPSSLDEDRWNTWQVIANHSDVLDSIYECGEYDKLAFRVDESVEKLRTLLRK